MTLDLESTRRDLIDVSPHHRLLEGTYRSGISGNCFNRWRAMMSLKEPYGAMPDNEEMPFRDFNKEILAPGLLPDYPAGAIGVRVDGDFYSIAALPYDKYLNISIRDIVKEFWPSKFESAEFGEDSVTTPEEIKVVEAFEAHRQKHARS